MIDEQRQREERAAFARLREGDLGAREALVERYLPLVRHLARRYSRASEPLEDLVQVGSIGLLNAIDRYDPASGSAFSSYAVPTILGEVRRHFRDRTWSVRVPRSLKDLVAESRDGVRAPRGADTDRDRARGGARHGRGAAAGGAARFGRAVSRLARPPGRRG